MNNNHENITSPQCPFSRTGIMRAKKMGMDGRREMETGARRDGDFLQMRKLSGKHC